MSTPATVRRWHELAAAPDPAVLRELLAEDAVFRSPAVHAPQEGRDRVHAYLWAALAVLGPTLTYVDEWHAERSAVLRFAAVVDGLDVDGVDLLEWDATGRITAFTVMVRPLRGLQALVTAMGTELSRQRDPDPGRP
ncbi:nuclear transport factor 2 family protein [Rhodococcus aerolatus]